MSDPAENRDVRGNTIKPHSVEAENVKAQNATVESEPSDANEIARKVDIDAKADLDSTTGVLKSSQVPDLAITSVSTVADEASRLSLSVEEGDVAIQTDIDTTFIFTGGDPSVNSNWSEIVLDVLDAISGSTISPDTVNAGSVNTDEGEISGETFVRAERGSESESIPAGEFVNAYTFNSKDNRDEFDSNAQFTPDKSGEYIFNVNVDVRGSTLANDRIQIRVENVTTASVVVPATEIDAPRDGFAYGSSVFRVNLTAGDDYEVQVSNFDNSFRVDVANSIGVITRSVIQ